MKNNDMLKLVEELPIGSTLLKYLHKKEIARPSSFQTPRRIARKGMGSKLCNKWIWMRREFIMKGKVSGSCQLSDIWDIKVIVDQFICDKVRSIKDFSKDFGLE